MNEKLLMRRAFDLALLGKGLVSPNPLVGCVIVHDGEIIAEGYHTRYGEAHAEVEAIRRLENKELLKEATLYVNLEPCSHFGKTPPCANLLVEYQIQKVVISNLDPNPLVAGKGIQKLQNAGIEVVTNVLEAEGKELNRRFFHFMIHQKPYIILKWAKTLDGLMGTENGEPQWFSHEISQKVVHKWRTEEDAVLVGTNTALFDNPHLTVRKWSGRNPVRIVIDRFLRLSANLNLFDGESPCFCYNLLKNVEGQNCLWIKLNKENFWEEMLLDLAKRKIQSVMVEGGSQILHDLIEKGIWNEMRVFNTPKMLGKGIDAPKVCGKLIQTEYLETDRLEWFRSE